MITKKNVFLMSFVYILYGIGIVVISANCAVSHSWCSFREDDPFGIILLTFLPLIPVFLFSLLTYPMKDEVFSVWWRFTRWFVPVIIIAQYIFMNSSGGGYIGNNDFVILFTSLFYLIFILVSLIKIIREYKRTKI